MRIDDAGPRTWLLAGIALWALLAWLLATAGMGGRVEPLPPDPGLLQPLPQVRTTAASRLGSLDQYSEVANRPLFAVDRRPQPFALAGPGDAEAVTPAFDYMLTGVLLTPDFRMATLQPPDGSDTVRVRVGEAPESLRSWRLVELGERSAVFEGPTGRQTVQLRVYDGVGGAPPTVVSQPAPRSDDPDRPGQPSQRPVEIANGAQPRPTVQSVPSLVPVPPSTDPAAQSREPPRPPGQSQTGPQPANDQAQMEAIRKRIQERRRKLRADSPIQPPSQRP